MAGVTGGRTGVAVGVGVLGGVTVGVSVGVGGMTTLAEALMVVSRREIPPLVASDLNGRLVLKEMVVPLLVAMALKWMVRRTKVPLEKGAERAPAAKLTRPRVLSKLFWSMRGRDVPAVRLLTCRMAGSKLRYAAAPSRGCEPAWT